MAKFGGSFKPLGSRPHGLPLPGSKPRGVKTGLPKNPDYRHIEEQVDAAIGGLSADKQALIPLGATLPERIVALGLIWLGYLFQAQRAEDGGRLRIGGAVVDFIVYVGGQRVIVRVQGDYWHSLPARRRADAMQAERLRAKHYRVCDLWESALYQAWVEGHLRQLIEQGVSNAA